MSLLFDVIVQDGAYLLQDKAISFAPGYLILFFNDIPLLKGRSLTPGPFIQAILKDTMTHDNFFMYQTITRSEIG
jgi:hypothetical protein